MSNQAISDQAPALDGFGARLSQVIAQVGMSQLAFANAIGTSSGFISDVIRNNKKPGAEILFAIRTKFGISIDWLLTGDGTTHGGSNIDLELLRAIHLQIKLARAAIIEGNATAHSLLVLLRDGRLREAVANQRLRAYLDLISPDQDDSQLAGRLYNSHLWTQDVAVQRRNLLAAVIAEFEARKPTDKMALLEPLGSTKNQVNTLTLPRNAGRKHIKR